MSVHFSSDHHFFHDNIIRYCNRPFNDASHMNEEMIRRWNEVVSEKDTVVYVGDLTAALRGRHAELRRIISILNGNKVLIRGNHDHESSEWYLEAGFKRVVDHVNLEGVLLIHYPLHEAFSRGIDPAALGAVEHVVHGHTHQADTPDIESHFNVAVDRHGFSPVPLTTVIPQYLRERFVESLSSFINHP